MDQKTGMKMRKSGARLSRARLPSGLKVSCLKDFQPAGGTCTKRFLPHQKRKVARAMRTPGTPKASQGPPHSALRKIGVSRVEVAAPTLMEK